MKYFQTKEQAFETMNRLELRITELAKKTIPDSRNKIYVEPIM